MEANRKELSEAPRDLSLAIASLSHTEGIRRYKTSGLTGNFPGNPDISD